MPHPTSRPSLKNALALRCAYCGETSLLRGRYALAPGCVACDYTFEREAGYTNAAAGLIAFPSICMLGFALAALLLVFATSLDWVLVVSLSSIAMIAFGAWYFPYAVALWMWIEHRLHPLDANDRYPKPSAFLEKSP